MKKIFSLIKVIVATAPTLASAQITNWSLLAGGNGHYYEAIPAPGGITWSNANLVASNRSGYLATITSSNENAFVFALVAQQSNLWYFSAGNSWYGPWLGGLQPALSTEPADGWSWVTGEPFGYANWSPQQPNNAGGSEDRIQLGGQASRVGAWNDLSNTNSAFVRSFIVEYDSDPNAVFLSMARGSNSQLTITWPLASASDFYLQFATNLAPPVTWLNATDEVALVGNEFVVTNYTAGVSRYYRLQAWEILFDGTSSEAFRGYKQTTFPATNVWMITPDRELMAAPLPGSLVFTNDIISLRKYDDFELRWEWKTSTNGNSGVFFRVTEPAGTNNSPAQTGPEFQLLDDADVNPVAVGSMGAAFGLFAPTNKVLVPVGQWNDCRLIVQNDHVEHWLNGGKVIDYQINGPDWATAVANFSGGLGLLPGFGQSSPASIALQHHGQQVWFRNIKIRRLSPQ